MIFLRSNGQHHTHETLLVQFTIQRTYAIEATGRPRMSLEQAQRELNSGLIFRVAANDRRSMILTPSVLVVMKSNRATVCGHAKQDAYHCEVKSIIRSSNPASQS